MPCLHCYAPNKPILARGLCQACYHRLRKTGSVERKNAVNKDQRCSIPDCGRTAWAKGLCSKHYLQAENPLKAVWRNLRTKAKAEPFGGFPPSWEQFEAFVADVGEKPSRKHQLRRRDVRQPWSQENSHWVAPVTVGSAAQSEYSRNWTLKARFGLEPQDYEEMAAAQHHTCAVCKRPEIQIHAKTGVAQRLSVDHDHLTGAVRELLCFRCNALLGAVDDSAELLRAAADYVERHRTRTQEVPE